jgi:membrane protease YdiL (CAAX protease family)
MKRDARKLFQAEIRALPSAVLVIGGMCIFGSFIHAGSWHRIIAFSGLALSALAISFSVQRIGSLPAVFGLAPVTRKVIRYGLAGMLYGLLLGMLYNVVKTDYLIPDSLTLFVFTAPLIGAAEELVFRGFVQTRSAVSTGVAGSILMGASGHTLYKFIVIRTVPAELDTYFPSLLALTFLTGLVLGLLKQGSGNVLPPVLAHACFDIIVYGGASLAPIWVWS